MEHVEPVMRLQKNKLFDQIVFVHFKMRLACLSLQLSSSSGVFLFFA